MHPDVLTISYSDPKAPTLFENSLKNTGFAIIKNHSIETDLINRVYDEWNSYFSSDSKMDFIFDEKKQDGYLWNMGFVNQLTKKAIDYSCGSEFKKK